MHHGWLLSCVHESLSQCPTVTECGNGVLLQCCHALLDADAQAVALYTAPCVTQLCSTPADLPTLSAPSDDLHA